VYRLSEHGDQAYLSMLDSSFVTNKIFLIERPAIDRLYNGIGFEISVREIKLDSPIHKYFPKDESDDDDEEGFTVVVEDTKAFLQQHILIQLRPRLLPLMTLLALSRSNFRLEILASQLRIL
jgi:hypothetical protein